MILIATSCPVVLLQVAEEPQLPALGKGYRASGMCCALAKSTMDVKEGAGSLHAPGWLPSAASAFCFPVQLVGTMPATLQPGHHPRCGLESLWAVFASSNPEGCVAHITSSFKGRELGHPFLNLCFFGTFLKYGFIPLINFLAVAPGF